MLKEVNYYSKSYSEAEKLRFINGYINGRMTFVDDQTLWGVNDYWATPLESLSRAAGDCEDYTIAKYFFLKYLGIPVAKLRLTYARARIGGPSSTLTQAHMVLAYYFSPDAEPLILDNQISEIRPASRRPDLALVFSFNDEGVWMTSGQPSPPGGSSGLTRWQDLLTRIKSEGSGQPSPPGGSSGLMRIKSEGSGQPSPLGGSGGLMRIKSEGFDIYID